ncbi:hypothetical protein CTEN210_08981 [Chaetoceros tenuissimus]|uniref:ShKT domain-containing protein n=1 Tax=Chaetoceros tenuissimus TaxID=426638 RepID=A0AAD3H6S7_9STRA|nr:hypothetical protein CTEN210_08981 [Chaetoceros tenuissimus]
MKKPIVLFLNLVSLFYNRPALCASIRFALCEDDNSSTFQISLHGGREQKSCEWLQTQQAQIRDELCKDGEVRTHCSHSCSSCCWDDKTFRFQMESGKLRSCFWLSKSSNRILKYCSADEHIRQRCRKSCGICGGSSTNLSSSQQGIITTDHVNMQHSHTSVEKESSSNLQSSKTRNKDLANDLRQSPSEIQNNDQDKKGQGSGLFAIFLSMIIFSVIFGVFFSKRIGQNVVTFKNVIISKDETEKVSIIMKTLWEGKMKPQREH